MVERFGAGLAGVLPAGVLPAGVLPVGALTTGVLPAGVLPAGVLPATNSAFSVVWLDSFSAIGRKSERLRLTALSVALLETR